MEWSREVRITFASFHTAQIIYMLASKANMPSFYKFKKKRSEKKKAEKREKKSLHAVPPVVPEG